MNLEEAAHIFVIERTDDFDTVLGSECGSAHNGLRFMVTHSSAFAAGSSGLTLEFWLKANT